MTNTWTKPSFIEVCMNAEVGAYQEDGGEPLDSPILEAESTRSLAPNPSDERAPSRDTVSHVA